MKRDCLAGEARAGSDFDVVITWGPFIHDDELHGIASAAAGSAAIACGVAALFIAATVDMGLAFTFIIVGAVYARIAVRHSRHRADSILQRSLAASLLEKGRGVLSEAA